jgi:hypothetical protein
MTPRKKISEKIHDAISYLNAGKVSQAITVLEAIHKKAQSKETGVKTTRPPNAYNNFVKEKFPLVKDKVNNNQDAMKMIAAMWAEEKLKKSKSDTTTESKPVKAKKKKSKNT